MDKRKLDQKNWIRKKQWQDNKKVDQKNWIRNQKKIVVRQDKIAEDVGKER